MTKAPSEHTEAVAFVAWIRRQPELDIAHNANEGHRTPQMVAKLKAEGFVPGFPDYTVWRRDTGVVRFVELKRSEKYRTSQEQKACIKSLGALGFIAVGHQEAIDFIRKELLK